MSVGMKTMNEQNDANFRDKTANIYREKGKIALVLGYCATF